MLKRSLTFALLTAFSAAAAAENRLQTVKVTAGDQPGLSKALPSGLLIIDQDTIASSPARNLTDLLDTLGSVTARRLYGLDTSGTSLDLLGFGSGANQNTLLLLNGQRLSNLDLSTPDLSMIPLSAIERIEVLPNAGAALYGNGAVGGTINIITRQRHDNHAGLRARGGSYNSYGGGAYAGGQSGPISALAAVDALHSDGYRDNSNLLRENAYGDLRFHGNGYQFYLTALGHRQQQDLPGPRTIDDNQNQFRNNPQGTNTPEDFADSEEFQLMPGVRINIGQHAQLNLDFAHRQQKQEFFFAPGFAGETRVERQSVTPRLQGQQQTGPVMHNWTLGLDLHHYDYRSRTSFGDRELTQRQQAWYLHNLMAVTERLNVSGGARTVETRLSGDSERHQQDGEMYEGGLSYYLDGGMTLFAGAQRSVRIANVDELSPFNPAIDPQTGQGYSLGARWQQDRQHSTFTLWRARISNEIIFDPSTFSNRNLDDPTLHEGISLNSRWRLEDHLYLTINGAIQKARFRGGDRHGNRVPLVPRRTLLISSDWQALDWLNLQISHRYVGRRYLDSDLDNAGPRLDSYRSTDLQLTGRYRQGFLQLGLYNLENNLMADFGTLGPDSQSLYPLPDRHLMVTAGIDF